MKTARDKKKRNDDEKNIQNKFFKAPTKPSSKVELTKDGKVL